MEANIFTVEITTPERKWAFDQVVSCTAPGVKGGFQVLYNHAPLLSQLEIGEVKIQLQDGSTSLFATSGGFLEVLNNKVSLLLETCERAEEIDVDRAQQAAERAKKRLHQKDPNIDYARAQAALQRALNRMKVARKVVNMAG
jgi:F-type H+-transporting ATPase subunit epsilon